MATVTNVIHENDVVALRENVGEWPAGSVGTAVSIYDTAALVEFSDARGRTLDMVPVAFARLDLQPRHIQD